MFERERGSACLYLRAFRAPGAAGCEAGQLCRQGRVGVCSCAGPEGPRCMTEGCGAEARPGQGSSRHRETWGSEWARLLGRRVEWEWGGPLSIAWMSKWVCYTAQSHTTNQESWASDLGLGLQSR